MVAVGGAREGVSVVRLPRGIGRLQKRLHGGRGLADAGEALCVAEVEQEGAALCIVRVWKQLEHLQRALVMGNGILVGEARPRLVPRAAAVVDRLRRITRRRRLVEVVRQLSQVRLQVFRVSRLDRYADLPPSVEVGRASCRERV